MLRLAFPAAILTTAVIMTFVNCWLAHLILRRLGVKLPWLRPFRLWRFPWYLAWGYILGARTASANRGAAEGSIWFMWG